MIKSTQTSLKFSNTDKLLLVKDFIKEYKSIISQFVDILWDEKKISLLLSKTITSKINTFLSSRIIQCAGKQASGIVRGTRAKQEKRKWKIEDFKSKNLLKKARKLQTIYDLTNVSKPKIENIEPELDSRFIKIDLENSTSFDGWITIKSITKSKSRNHLVIPFKRTKHFNKLYKKGTLKTGIRLSKDKITFMFDLPDVIKKSEGKTLGIDIGQITTISCSNNYVSNTNKHGYDLNKINSVLSRRKKGSLGFKRAQDHRTNYINWSVNQLNLTGIKQVNIECIKNLRKGKISSRKLSHWTYKDIFEKVKSYCSECGVHVHEVNPTYTSQRCSSCGWTRKTNRKGKQFKCGKCGFAADADLNASTNISLPLAAIGRQQRLKQTNRTGFYWNVLDQEIIVPDVKKIDQELLK